MLQARRLWLSLAATFAAVVVLATTGRADPLPKEACETVAAEHARLTEAGTPELVKKGPVWVLANLGQTRVQEVARYIQIHEQLLFKCGYDKLHALPGAETDDAASGKAEDSPPPLPQRKPIVPAAFKTRVVPAAKPVARQAPRDSPPPAPRRKTRVDDAYRPPPKKPAGP